MHTKQQLMELHAEHNEWQNKIKFYKDELKKFETELSEAIKVNADHDSMAEVEHFQNQFIMQREHLDIMRHDFKQYENAIEHMQQHEVDNTVEGLHVLQGNNKERLEQFEKLFHELRHEFYEFLHKDLVL